MTQTSPPTRPNPLPAPAVFLDRDDTLNVNADLPPEAFPGTPGDLYLPEFVRLLPGAAEACRDLKAAGYALVVITNQGGAARGHASLRDIDATNARVCELLEGRIDACYSAPHHPDAVVEHLREAHPWRKDGPGMIETAAREQHLDLSRSWMVGDKDRDRLAGIGAGIPEDRCIVIEPGAGARFRDLAAAAAHILKTQPDGRPPAQHAADQEPGLTAIPATTATLRAPEGEPLADAAVRDTVRAAAESIAERTGVRLLGLRVEPASVEATLATHRLGATAFMAELRRNTNTWHTARFGVPLWAPRPAGPTE